MDSISGASSFEGLEALLGLGVGLYIVMLVICVVCLIAAVKIFSKAGIAGWKVIVPFYSNYLQYKLVFGNGWLFLLNLIPFVGYVMPIVSLTIDGNMVLEFEEGVSNFLDWLK